jgi:uncharacterized protein DUF5995
MHHGRPIGRFRARRATPDRLEAGNCRSQGARRAFSGRSVRHVHGPATGWVEGAPLGDTHQRCCREPGDLTFSGGFHGGLTQAIGRGGRSVTEAQIEPLVTEPGMDLAAAELPAHQPPGTGPPGTVDPGVVAAATATEIDVVAQVNRILVWSRENTSRIGYFAALYWHVATTLSQAVKSGVFQDAAQMERLNEVLFRRYLDAVECTWSGDAPTGAWRMAIEAADDKDLIVAQHLLLASNAHINFDLAVAVAQTIPASALPAFRPDYNKMNDLLSSLIEGMAADISRFWPLLRMVSKISSGADDAIVAFSLRAARAEAWRTAVELAALDPPARAVAIARRDAEVLGLSRLVVRPGFLLRAVVRVLRFGERGSVVDIIDDLLA